MINFLESFLKRDPPKDRHFFDLLVTLWPSFPHFNSFARDDRLKGIRLNPAMIELDELAFELSRLEFTPPKVPIYFDVKGKQLRITDVFPSHDHLEIRLNHPITVPTPTTVLFKAAADYAELLSIEENGYRLIFAPGRPRFWVKPGESIHIRHPGLQVGGHTFTEYELAKIELALRARINRYFLSYVESQRDVDEFRELVGRDCEILLKIESKKGLEFVAQQFRKTPNISLVAARGDLYVELDRPHNIMAALKLIIERDPDAVAASRIMLSTVLGPTLKMLKHKIDQDNRFLDQSPILKVHVHDPIPECADFLELAWLYDIGYRRAMLCDEICLKEELLATALDAVDAFRQEYVK